MSTQQPDSHPGQNSCLQDLVPDSKSLQHYSSSHGISHSGQLSAPHQAHTFISLLQSEPRPLRVTQPRAISPQQLSQAPDPLPMTWPSMAEQNSRSSTPSVGLYTQTMPSISPSTVDHILGLLHAEALLPATCTQPHSRSPATPRLDDLQHSNHLLIQPQILRSPQWPWASQQGIEFLDTKEQDHNPQRPSISLQHAQTQNQPCPAHSPSKESPGKALAPPRRPKKSQGSSLMKELTEQTMKKIHGPQAVTAGAGIRADQVQNRELDALLLSLDGLDLANFRPDELLDKVTMLYNAAYKPKEALVFDHCLMAGLVFCEGCVLLGRDVTMTPSGQRALYKPPQVSYNSNTLPWTLDSNVVDTIHNCTLERTELPRHALKLSNTPQLHRPLKLGRLDLGLSSTPYSLIANFTSSSVIQPAEETLVDVWLCAEMYEMVIPIEQTTGSVTNYLSDRFCRWFDEKEVCQNPDVGAVWTKFLCLAFGRRMVVAE